MTNYNHRKLVRRPNGFGSYKTEIAVIINRPFERFLLTDDWAYEVLSESKDTITFLYEVKNRYAGDDETIVEALWRDFPSQIIEEKQFRIDWEHSGY